MLQGYLLKEDLCDRCKMPLMEQEGSTDCVVCPVLLQKWKKANLQRETEKLKEQKALLEKEVLSHREISASKKKSLDTDAPAGVQKTPGVSQRGPGVASKADFTSIQLPRSEKNATKYPLSQESNKVSRGGKSIFQKSAQPIVQDSVAEPLDCHNTLHNTMMPLESLEEVGSFLLYPEGRLSNASSTGETKSYVKETMAASTKEATAEESNADCEKFASSETKREVKETTAASTKEATAGESNADCEKLASNVQTSSLRKVESVGDCSAPGLHLDMKRREEEIRLERWEQLRLDGMLVRTRRLLVGWHELPDECHGVECDGFHLLTNGKTTECIVCGGSGSGADGVYDLSQTAEGPRVNGVSDTASKMKTTEEYPERTTAIPSEEEEMVCGTSGSETEDVYELSQTAEGPRVDEASEADKKTKSNEEDSETTTLKSNEEVETEQKARNEKDKEVAKKERKEPEPEPEPEEKLAEKSEAGPEQVSNPVAIEGLEETQVRAYAEESTQGESPDSNKQTPVQPVERNSRREMKEPKKEPRQESRTGAKKPPKLDKKKERRQKTKGFPEEIATPDFRMNPRKGGARTPQPTSQAAKRTVRELQEDFDVKRRVVSKEIGKRMLKGWTLLDMACPYCVMPLMTDVSGKNEICVLCGPVKKGSKSISSGTKVSRFKDSEAGQQSTLVTSRSSSAGASNMTVGSSKTAAPEQPVSETESSSGAFSTTRSSEKSKRSSSNQSSSKSAGADASKDTATSSSISRNQKQNSMKGITISSKDQTPTSEDAVMESPEERNLRVRGVEQKVESNSATERAASEHPPAIERVRPAPLVLTPAPRSQATVPTTVVLLHGNDDKKAEPEATNPSLSPHFYGQFLVSQARDSSSRGKSIKADPPALKGYAGVKKKALEPPLLGLSEEASPPILSETNSWVPDADAHESVVPDEQAPDENADAPESVVPDEQRRHRQAPPTPEGGQTRENPDISHDNVLTLEIPLDFSVNKEESLLGIIEAAQMDSPTLDVDRKMTRQRHVAPSPGMAAAEAPIHMASPMSLPSPVSSGEKPLTSTSARSLPSPSGIPRFSSKPRISPEMALRPRATNAPPLATAKSSSSVSTMIDSMVSKPDPPSKSKAISRAVSELPPPVPAMVSTKKKTKKENLPHVLQQSAPTPRSETPTKPPIPASPSTNGSITPKLESALDQELVSLVSGAASSLDSVALDSLLERIEETRTKLRNATSECVGNAIENQSYLRDLILSLSRATKDIQEAESIDKALSKATSNEISTAKVEP